MATLQELADSYTETAARLRLAIRALEEKKNGMAPRQRNAAEHDLRLLRQMLRETREVGEVVRHYYDRTYWHNRRYTF